MVLGKAFAVLVSAASLAGAARGETMTQSQVMAAAVLPRVAGSAMVLPVAKTPAIRVITMLTTAVDHQFAPRGLVGSAGLLCGLKPTADDHGLMSSHIPDKDGKFVGAKLSLAF